MPIAAVESERAVIGAVLNGSKAVQEWVSSELSPSDFYDGNNARLFKAIQTILDEGLEVNPVSVKERSRVGAAFLSACQEASNGIAPSALKTIISDVKSSAVSRGMASAFNEALAECNSGRRPDAVLEALEGKLYSNGVAGEFSKITADAHDVSEDVVKSVIDKVENPGRVEISTGLTLFDRAIIGLRPKFYVIGARPSMGKSALAQTVSSAVLDQGYGVITLSAEMSRDEILEREVAARSDINVRKIQSGRGFEDGELARVLDAPNRIPKDRWRIIDKSMGIAAIRRVCRIEKAKMARKGIKLALIVLDYIQLFADGENREQAVSAVSRGCKLMSQELGVAVIGLSQLNRGLEHRDDKRPTLADLRESGAIEQDADVVAFVYRASRYDSNIPEEQAEIIIAKQRGGPIGSMPVHFNPKTTTFTDDKPYERPVPPVHPGKEGGDRADGNEAEGLRSKPALLTEAENLFDPTKQGRQRKHWACTAPSGGVTSLLSAVSL